MKKIVLIMTMFVVGTAHATRWADMNTSDSSLFPIKVVSQIDLDSFKSMNGFGYYRVRDIRTVKETGQIIIDDAKEMEMECRTTAFRVRGEDKWLISNNRDSFVYNMTCKNK